MTTGPQAVFVVEYPCDRFCRIEVDLSGEPGRVTLQQLREKADGMHQRVHEPELAEADEPVAEQAATTGQPAPTVFLSAPGGRTTSGETERHSRRPRAR